MDLSSLSPDFCSAFKYHSLSCAARNNNLTYYSNRQQNTVSCFRRTGSTFFLFFVIIFTRCIKRIIYFFRNFILFFQFSFFLCRFFTLTLTLSLAFVISIINCLMCIQNKKLSLCYFHFHNFSRFLPHFHSFCILFVLSFIRSLFRFDNFHYYRYLCWCNVCLYHLNGIFVYTVTTIFFPRHSFFFFCFSIIVCSMRVFLLLLPLLMLMLIFYSNNCKLLNHI